MQRLLDLFIAVHGREPRDGKEFSEWCAYVKRNSRSLNSRGKISYLPKLCGLQQSIWWWDSAN